MKKILLICLTLTAFCVACEKQQGTTQIRIGIAVPTASHGWTGGVGWWAAHTVDQLKEQYPNILFNVVHSANAVQQITDLENLAQWGMNYLVILPHESAPLTRPVRDIAEKGVRVIVVDRGLTDSSFGYVNIAGDNPGMGRVSGEWLANTMIAEELTYYAPMGGMPIVIDTERMDGFFSEMNRQPTLVNLLGGNNYQFANFSAQDALRITETYLQQFPRIDAIFCQDDNALDGVLQAVMESNRNDVKIIFGGAGSREVLRMIMNGHPQVRATATYHPSMIADGIQYAVDVALGRISADFATASSPIMVVLPSELVDISNVMDHYNPDSTF